MALSSLYETAPQGYLDQPLFLNAVLSVQTDLDPVELLQAMQQIEDGHLRRRTIHWGPRTLDLDLLLHGTRPGQQPGPGPPPSAHHHPQLRPRPPLRDRAGPPPPLHRQVLQILPGRTRTCPGDPQGRGSPTPPPRVSAAAAEPWPGSGGRVSHLVLRLASACLRNSA